MKNLILLTIFLLAACRTVPEYKSIEAQNDRAFLRLTHDTDQIILSSVALVVRTQGDLICGEGHLPNPEKLFVSSKRNPLVSDLNPEGVWIPAGVKFFFTATSHSGASLSCQKNASFIPKKDRQYRLFVTDAIFFDGVKSVNFCNVKVIQEENLKANIETEVLADNFQIESCKTKAN